MQREFFKYLILLIVTGITIKLNSQDIFEVTIASDDNEQIYKGLQHSNGHYYFTGRKGFGFSNSDPYILKVNNDGTYDDLSIVKGDTNGFFSTFEFLNNQNILFIGQCKFSDTLINFNHLWLCEIDTNLNIINEHFYYMLKDDYFKYHHWYSTKDEDGNIIISGNYTYYPSLTDMVFIKVSQEGDTLSSKSYHYQYNQDAGPIIVKPDGDYLSVIERMTASSPLSLVELDSDFSILSINRTPDYYYNMSGYTPSWIDESAFLQSAVWYNPLEEISGLGVAQINSEYQLMNEIVITKPDTTVWPAWLYSHCYLNDTTIYVCGFQNYMSFYTLTPSNIFLYLIDSELNILGELNLQGEVNYEMYGIAPSNDGGCIIYGVSYDNPEGIEEYDIYIRKFLREEIELATGIGEPTHHHDIYSYLDPANQILSIHFDFPAGPVVLNIYDLAGRLITTTQCMPYGNKITFDTNFLQGGIYVFQVIISDHSIYSSKFLKL